MLPTPTPLFAAVYQRTDALRTVLESVSLEDATRCHAVAGALHAWVKAALDLREAAAARRRRDQEDADAAAAAAAEAAAEAAAAAAEEE